MNARRRLPGERFHRRGFVMCTIPLTLVLVGIIPSLSSEFRPPTGDDAPICERRVAEVVLITQGRQGWEGEAAHRIVGELKTRLASCCIFQEARFDEAPTLRPDFAVKGARRDLLLVEPRTPLSDAIEIGLDWLITVPSPRTMVVITHKLLDAPSVSVDRLIELAQHSETTIHRIYLARRKDVIGGLFRLARPLRNGVVRLAETLGLKERGTSARDTSVLLKLMADATGGKRCVAVDDQGGVMCADAIAAEILVLMRLSCPPKPTPGLGQRSCRRHMPNFGVCSRHFSRSQPCGLGSISIHPEQQGHPGPKRPDLPRDPGYVCNPGHPPGYH